MELVGLVELIGLVELVGLVELIGLVELSLPSLHPASASVVIVIVVARQPILICSSPSPLGQIFFKLPRRPIGLMIGHNCRQPPEISAIRLVSLRFPP